MNARRKCKAASLECNIPPKRRAKMGRPPRPLTGGCKGLQQEGAQSKGCSITLPLSPVLAEPLEKWFASKPQGLQQDCAELCATLLFGEMGRPTGAYEARRQNALPEKQSLQSPVLISMPHMRRQHGPVELQAVVLQWHEDSLGLRLLLACNAKHSGSSSLLEMTWK